MILRLRGKKYEDIKHRIERLRLQGIALEFEVFEVCVVFSNSVGYNFETYSHLFVIF